MFPCQHTFLINSWCRDQDSDVFFERWRGPCCTACKKMGTNGNCKCLGKGRGRDVVTGTVGSSRVGVTLDYLSIGRYLILATLPWRRLSCNVSFGEWGPRWPSSPNFKPSPTSTSTSSSTSGISARDQKTSSPLQTVASPSFPLYLFTFFIFWRIFLLYGERGSGWRGKQSMMEHDSI